MTDVTVTMRVEWVDTDAAGHHAHASVAHWVEAPEARLCRASG